MWFPARATWRPTPSRRPWQLGAKPVTCSDSTGWIYDPDGIDVATLIDVKQVRRARLTEYAKARPNAEYHEGKGVWTVKCDVALPCATQNELHAGRRQDRW